MQMLCPECMGPLEMIDGGRARCTVHGGQYEVLFSRWVPAQAAAAGEVDQRGKPPAAPGRVAAPCPSCGREWRVSAEHVGKTVRCKDCQAAFVIAVPQSEPEAYAVAPEACKKHPGVTADYSCGVCGAPICKTCAFAQPNGQQFCPDCVAGGRRAGPAAVVDFSERGRLRGKECVNHPGVPAAHFCKACNAAVCETCTFKFPGNVYVCPACAASPSSALGPKQTKYLIGSFVCAVLAMLAVALMFIMIPAAQGGGEAEALGAVMVFVVLGLSITGTALSAAARIPRQPTPVAVWIALIWNMILLVGVVLLCLVGALMGA